METRNFEIVKYGRVWIEAKLGNYKCKIKIDEKTKGLYGNVDLLVKDISIRSKYGTDLRFECVSPETNVNVYFKHDRYNHTMVSELRDLGGVWEAEEKFWILPEIVSDKVEEMEFLYNTDIINIQIRAKRNIFSERDSVKFLGYEIAKATGRDSGAKLCDGISIICGEITSDGSRKNWGSKVMEDSIFRLRVGFNLLNNKYKIDEGLNYISENWMIKIID